MTSSQPPSTPKRKLRWHQFSLRTLLIFIASLFSSGCNDSRPRSSAETKQSAASATDASPKKEISESHIDPITDWEDFPKELPAVPQSEKPLAQPIKWTDAKGNTWTAFQIDLPDKSESFLFVCMSASKGFSSGHIQGIVYKGEDNVTPLPYNVGGKIKIDFFLFERLAGEGPFVRLQDYWGEYLVDLQKKKTFRIIRTERRSFMGDVSGGNIEDSGFSIFGSGDEMIVSVGDGEAKEITDLPIAGMGKRLGRIHN